MCVCFSLSGATCASCELSDTLTPSPPCIGSCYEYLTSISIWYTIQYEVVLYVKASRCEYKKNIVQPVADVRPHGRGAIQPT